uniref:Uncharacterized protein n=1 Tax=Chlamydomonas euryale TaxID=1486919 RepID=A0A7R9V3I5_9CHLO
MPSTRLTILTDYCSADGLRPEKARAAHMAPGGMAEHASSAQARLSRPTCFVSASMLVAAAMRAQKSSSVENTCCCAGLLSAPPARAMTPDFWYSPTRRSKKLVLPCRPEHGQCVFAVVQDSAFRLQERGGRDRVFEEVHDSAFRVQEKGGRVRRASAHMH